MSGVPEPKHQRRPSGALPTAEYFDASTKYLQTVQKSSTASLTLLERKVVSEESRLEWDKEMQKRRLEVDEKAQKVQTAKDILADPNMPEHLRTLAENSLEKYLDF